MLNRGRVPARFAEVGDVQSNPVLTSIAIGYSPTGYVADQVLPRVMVEREKFQYAVWSQLRRRVEGDRLLRQPKTASARTDFTVSFIEDVCAEYSIEIPVDNREQRNADPGIDPLGTAARDLAYILRNGAEKRVADLMTSTGSVTQNTTLTGTDQWSDGVNSDPISDVETGTDIIQKAVGVMEGELVLVISKPVERVLRHHLSLLEFYKYTSGGVVTSEQMARAFGVGRVVVAEATYDSANEGQTASGAYIWGKHAVLAYVPSAPARDVPAAGYQFVNQDIRAYNWFDNTIKSQIVGGDEIMKARLTHTGAAYLMYNAIA